MKALPWILAGIGMGVAATLIIYNGQPEYATGHNGLQDGVDGLKSGVERAARKSFGWGTKQRAEGKVSSVAGAVKQGVGHLTGNQQMADKGTADRVAGNVKDAAGQVGHAVAETIHDLNK